MFRRRLNCLSLLLLILSVAFSLAAQTARRPL